jgi:hypothetical protein
VSHNKVPNLGTIERALSERRQHAVGNIMGEFQWLGQSNRASCAASLIAQLIKSAAMKGRTMRLIEVIGLEALASIKGSLQLTTRYTPGRRQQEEQPVPPDPNIPVMAGATVAAPTDDTG